MVISELKEVLEVLKSVGIDEAVFDPTENGTFIRAATSDKSIIVFDEHPVKFGDCSIGVQSVKALLSRLYLFDQDTDPKIELTKSKDGERVSNITIKKGRKKCTYRCASPKDLLAPSKVPGELKIDDDNCIVLSKSFTSYLSEAINSISQTGRKGEQMLTMKVDDSNADISIFDGEDDGFHDTIENVGMEESEKGCWEIQPFQRVMNKAINGKDEIHFSILEHGIGIFNIEGINILIRPIL